jgi:hypothetical protein
MYGKREGKLTGSGYREPISGKADLGHPDIRWTEINAREATGLMRSYTP